MRQSIRGYSDGLISLAALSGETSLSTVAAELSSVTSVIDSSDDLRRALSDTGIPVAARRGVLHDLFESHIGPTTLRLLDFALDSDRASETVAGIEWMAERFDAATEGMEPVGDVVLGTKTAEERVNGFATAVLETVDDERTLVDIEDELFRFSRVVAGTDALRDAMSNRDYSTSIRKGIVTDLLSGKVQPATLALASYATQVGRPRDFEVLLGELINRVAAESNRRLADVRAAVEMDAAQEAKLAAALSRAVGRNVEIRVTVDPSVVAGFVAVVGDTVVDGSARHQLELLKERLVMPESQVTTGQITTEERH